MISEYYLPVVSLEKADIYKQFNNEILFKYEIKIYADNKSQFLTL